MYIHIWDFDELMQEFLLLRHTMNDLNGAIDLCGARAVHESIVDYWTHVAGSESEVL